MWDAGIVLAAHLLQVRVRVRLRLRLRLRRQSEISPPTFGRSTVRGGITSGAARA